MSKLSSNNTINQANFFASKVTASHHARVLAIRNVCVDPNATLLFHAALLANEQAKKPDPARQSRMLNSYNAKLRSFLVANHYVDTFEFHAISGRDIIQKFGYRQCPNK